MPDATRSQCQTPCKILQELCVLVFIDSYCIYLLSLSLSASLLCCGDVEKNSSTPRASRNEFREKSSFPGRAICWKSEGPFCPYLPFRTDPASQLLMPRSKFQKISHLCEFLGANWGNRGVGVAGSSVLEENESADIDSEELLSDKRQPSSRFLILERL